MVVHVLRGPCIYILVDFMLKNFLKKERKSCIRLRDYALLMRFARILAAKHRISVSSLE